MLRCHDHDGGNKEAGPDSDCPNLSIFLTSPMDQEGGLGMVMG